MHKERNVTRRECSQWIKWFKGQGFYGPYSGLTVSHEWIKRLYKELRKKPPTIIEIRPRDQRTIASALTRYMRRAEKVQIISGGSAEGVQEGIKFAEGLDEIHELIKMQLQGVPEFLYKLAAECRTPGILLCSKGQLSGSDVSWIECIEPCNQNPTKTPMLCQYWKQCVERHRPTLRRYKLLVGADNAGGVRIQLPSRPNLPDFQEMFPVLNKLTLYSEICRFEDLGTTWLQRCAELLPYLEDENRNQSYKLEKHIYEPALEALEAWNHQASLIGSWNKLLG